MLRWVVFMDHAIFSLHQRMSLIAFDTSLNVILTSFDIIMTSLWLCKPPTQQDEYMWLSIVHRVYELARHPRLFPLTHQLYYHNDVKWNQINIQWHSYPITTIVITVTVSHWELLQAPWENSFATIKSLIYF